MGAGLVIILGAVAFSAFWTTKFFKEVYSASKLISTASHTDVSTVHTPLPFRRDFIEFLLTGVLVFSLYLVANNVRVHYKLLSDDEYPRSDDFVNNWFENISTTELEVG